MYRWGLFITLLALAAFFSAPATATSCLVRLGSPWSATLDFAQVERTLAHGRIVKIEKLIDVQNERVKRVAAVHATSILVLTYEDGSRGVFKPDISQSARAEVGAYRAMHRLLGMKMIPPTIERNIASEVQEFVPGFNGNTNGSIQLFVVSSIDWTSSVMRNLVTLDPRESSDRDAFYFVFGQWDRNSGNQIVDDSWSQALIDNTAIRDQQYLRYGDAPFVAKLPLLGDTPTEWSHPFPFDSALRFENPTQEQMREFLQGKGEPRYIQNVLYWWFRQERSNFILNLVAWRGRLWAQAPSAYSPIRFDSLSRRTLEAYAQLTFPTLRTTLDERAFSDERILEILEHRDQLLEIAKTVPLIP